VQVFAQAKFAFSIHAAMSSALFRSTIRIESCHAVIRVYDSAGNVIETHEQAGEFKRVVAQSETKSRHALKRDG
jgi:hypothetical protein